MQAKTTKSCFLLFLLGLSAFVTVAQPTITGFTPTTGKPGDVITITGTNFNIVAANNLVRFGALTAVPSTATATVLTVTVPIGATIAPITVVNTTTNLLAQTTRNFLPIFAPSKGSFSNSDIGTASSLAAATNVRSISAADFDGDGKADISAVGTGSDFCSVYRNTSGTNSVSFANAIGLGMLFPISTAAGDLDGDGKPDVVFLSNNGTGSIVYGRNTSIIGDINFSWASFNPGNGLNAQTVGLADIDGDGKLDMVVANAAGNIRIYPNTSSVGTISFATPYSIGINDTPINCLLTDLDGDGKIDFVVPKFSAGQFSIIRNTSTVGNLSFGVEVVITLPGGGTNYITGLTALDVDADGKNEIIGTYNTASNFYIYPNTSTSGTISFGTVISVASTTPGSFGNADMDGDGKLDLLMGISGTSTARILRNNYSGAISSTTFEAPVTIATGQSPNAPTVIDLNNDGLLDIVLGNFLSASFSFFLNNPSYTWYSKQSGSNAIQNPLNWGINADGSGANPVDFSNANHIFQLANNALNMYATSAALNNNATINIPTSATLSITNNLTHTGKFSGDGVVNFNGTTAQTINGVGQYNNIIVSNTNGVSIGSTNTMISVSGSLRILSGSVLNTNNNLTLTSTATNTASIGTSAGTINGNVTVQRFIAGGNSNGTPGRRGFRFFSHPFTTDIALTQLRATGNIDITGTGGAANGFDESTTNNPSAFWYSPTAPGAGNASTVGSGATNDNGWIAFTRGNGTIDGSNPNLWRKGAGIRALFRGAKDEGLTYDGTNYTLSDVTLKMSGALNMGNQSFVLPAGANDQWSLVGNPYPSPINIRSLLATQRSSGLLVGATAYVFNPNKASTTRGGYDAINISTAGNYALPAYGVVLVQNKQATASTINFTETDKTTGADLNFRTILQGTTVGIDLVDATTQEVVDDYNLRFSNTAQNGTMGDIEDGGKLLNNHSIYSISEGDNKMLKIDSRPQPIGAESKVRLGLYSGEAKSFILKVTDLNLLSNATVYLKDKWLNVEQAIINNSYSYSFATTTDTASQGNGRFELVFKTGATLPVTFTSVKAAQQGSGIQVAWNVANEVNLNWYEVEESVDGVNFSKATTQIAQNKTSYSWYDALVTNGNNYYRIKAINKDGSNQYSQVVNVKLGSIKNEFSIYPNPVKGNTINLQLSNVEKGSYTITLYNQLGQQLISKTLQHNGGSGSETITVSRLLAQGTYRLLISNGSSATNKTIVVE